MDYDNDGMLDIIVGDRDGYVNYFMRTGTGIHDLTSEGKISTKDSVIDVGNNSAPFIIDWNEDGLDDMLVGRESTTGGSLWLYLNSGTAGNPEWTTYTPVNVNGSPIGYSRTMPHVIDISLDGKKDLIIGEDYGHIYYLENTGTNASPIFTKSEMLEANGSPIVFPSGYTDLKPYVVDWNDDGWLDIITGNYVNYVYLFLSYPLSIGTSPSTENVEFLVAGSPFTGAFSFIINLEEQRAISISLYSLDGRLAETRDFGMCDTGEQILNISSAGYPAGTYIVTAQLGNAVFNDRLVLLR